MTWVRGQFNVKPSDSHPSRIFPLGGWAWPDPQKASPCDGSQMAWPAGTLQRKKGDGFQGLECLLDIYHLIMFGQVLLPLSTASTSLSMASLIINGHTKNCAHLELHDKYYITYVQKYHGYLTNIYICSIYSSIPKDLFNTDHQIDHKTLKHQSYSRRDYEEAEFISEILMCY